MTDDENAVEALYAVFAEDGSVDYYVPVRVPPLSDEDQRIADEFTGKLPRIEVPRPRNRTGAA